MLLHSPAGGVSSEFVSLSQVKLDRQQLLALVQTDAELGDILMRAFILRRVPLSAGHSLQHRVPLAPAHNAPPLPAGGKVSPMWTFESVTYLCNYYN